jgi:hypothetical protein
MTTQSNILFTTHKGTTMKTVLGIVLGWTLMIASAYAANPILSVSNITQTSATVSWTDVGGAPYRVDYYMPAGSYGMQYVTQFRTNALGYQIVDAAVGRSYNIIVVSEGVPFSSAFTALKFSLLSPPRFIVSQWYGNKLTGLPRLPYTLFYPGLLYRWTVKYAGNPVPALSLVSGPAGMVLTGNVLTYTGYEGGVVKLRLTNSEGTITFSYDLTAK